MTDEKKTENTDPPKAAASPDVLEKIDSLIISANVAAERLEKGNSELKELISRQELMKIERSLGGRSDAGTPSKTPNQIAKDNAKQYLEGTGFEHIVDDLPD